ncbi:MAG TPA: hypothetical protein PKE07_03910, partial [Lacibacter sp.]|nr:hypothetical protein [Lacibacter sp.]
LDLVFRLDLDTVLVFRIWVFSGLGFSGFQGNWLVVIFKVRNRVDASINFRYKSRRGVQPAQEQNFPISGFG